MQIGIHSPGLWPIGVLDNQLMGCCIVTPYSPPVEPRARRTDSPMMGVPPFFDFLAIQKIIKKSTPQKIDLFGNFGDLLYVFHHCFTVFVPFWGPQDGKRENRDFVKIVLPPRQEHDFEEIAIFEKTPKK